MSQNSNVDAYLTFPMPNVWLGVSVEDQAAADARIPWLLKTPAAVRFLSIEPLLGPVDLRAWLHKFEVSQAAFIEGKCFGGHRGSEINWVIVGGESGPGARPMEAEWVDQICDQCNAASVPFFFKQWGEFNCCRVRVGKKKAGRMLRGRTWDDMPKGVAR